VYSRVARGEFVFDDPDLANLFVQVARTVANDSEWAIHAWCLLGNHYHLVVKTGKVPLWRSMARLQGTVSRLHNRRQGVLGRLWQSRYHARVIDTEDYHRQVLAYVHLNPVAAGLVEDPLDYEWCGHGALIGRRSVRLVAVKSALVGFGEEVCDAAEHYLQWTRAVAEARWARASVADLPWWKGARHVDEVADADRHPDSETYDGGAPPEEFPSLTFPQFLSRFADASDCRLEELASSSRRAATVERRVEIATLAVSVLGFKPQEIAVALGMHGTSVSRWVSEGERRRASCTTFRNRLSELEAAVAGG
jgi:REP element-mobilizing transposase RayT